MKTSRLPKRLRHRHFPSARHYARQLRMESLENRSLLATFNHVFTDINPDQSDLDPSDPDGASGGRVGGMSVVAGDNQTFYAASEFGGIFKSTDGGREWEHLEGHLPMVAWDVEVDPGNTNRVYATSFYDGRVNPISGIQVSNDAGQTWVHPLTAHANPQLEGTALDNTPQAGYNASNARRTEPSAFGIGIRPDNTNIVFIGTNAGVARTTDGGLTWQIIDPTPATSSNSNVWDVVVQAGGPMGLGIVDIVGDDGHLRSVDGGNVWTNANSLPAAARGRGSIAVSPDESYVLLIAGANGTLFESDDAGTTWTNLGRTDPIRQGNRIPFVVSNQKNNVNVDGDAALENVFDIWTGGVSLYRVQCVTPDAPASGGAARCPAGANPLPTGWFGGFTRGGLGAATGAHDDVGDLLFDSEAAIDANPVLYSGDGGIYYAQTTSASPTGVANLVFEEPDVTPHALWIYGMAGFDVAGLANENLYIGMQDAGDFATTNLGAGLPTWHQEDCCDIFDYATDGTTVVYQRGFSPPPGRGFNLILANPAQTATSVVPNYPADGLLSQFKFGESIETFGANSFVVLMQDCSNPATNGLDDDGDGMTDEADELSNGCPMTNGGDGGVYITPDITVNPIVWTELGNATEPNSATLVDVQVSMSGGTPTFYVLVGGGNGRTADQLWSFTGTNPAGAWTRIDNNIPGGGGVNIFAADPNNPQRLYATRVNPGGAFFSTDGGATWNADTDLLNALTGNGAFQYLNTLGPTEFTNLNGYPQPTLLAYNPEDPNMLVAGGADSGIFLSTDAGASWRLLSDPLGTDGPDIPHLPRPRFAYFDGESGEIYIGTQGRGVWRILPDFTLDPDRFEPNDTIATSTILGSPPKIIERDLTIHNTVDVDFFQYTAQDTGKLIINIFFNALQGDLDLRVRDSSGDIVATATQSIVTPGRDRERVVIPVVTQEEYYIEVLSGVQHTNEYALEIENFQVRAPFKVDLRAASDSGRHDSDDVTNDTTATFDVFLDDADLTSMGFVRDDDFDVQVFNNGVLLGQAAFVSGQRWEFTADPGDLQEGHNNFITAAVLIRDRAIPEATGRGEFSPDLQVTLDTIAPTGTVHLFPDQDTGIWGFPETMHDGVTGAMTPLLYGATEANALVRAALDRDPLIPGDLGDADGTAVAIPLDGDEAFPPPPGFDGNYFLQTVLPLMDGSHTLEVFFQDLAGNESLADAADATLTIFIDTSGPRIENVTRGDVSTDNLHSFDGVSSVFEPKPSDTGPDPLVHSIVIHFSDLPDRTLAFADYHALFLALAEEEGNYSVKGDHNGYIAIVDVNVTFTTIPDDGEPEVAEVELVFDRPLPDDRYTVFVSDNLSDPAGNPLDGESGALGPFNGNDVPEPTPPIFPTGDGAHGGDFWGRFTIDSRPEIGAFALGTTYLDINGNMVFDTEGQDNDYTNRDIAFAFGFRDDRVFAGNFAAAGAASATGYDKLGGYGTQGQGAAWNWRLDFNHDGVVDFTVLSGVQTQGDPVAGRFSAAHPGDEIGLFNAGKWWLDSSGDNNIGGPGDTFLQGNMRGQPIVGDFDGDGMDDLGAWDGGNAGTQFDGVFQFDLASNGLTGNSDATIQFDLPGTFQKAMSADMNEDGIDDIGLFVSRREAVPPTEAAEWFFLISTSGAGGPGTGGSVAALNHPFRPVPFGTDLFAQFGDEAAMPVVGNFDPPTDLASIPFPDPVSPLDVNGDGDISPLDALLVFNELNNSGSHPMSAPMTGPEGQIWMLDTSGDEYLSALDALVIFNHLNAQVEVAPEGESSASDAELFWLLAEDQVAAPSRRRR